MQARQVFIFWSICSLFIWFIFLQVAEFDKPQNLFQNPSTIFYSLVQEAGLINGSASVDDSVEEEATF